MGVFSKIGLSSGFKKPSVANVSSKQTNAGYCAEGQQPVAETTQLASYLVPGSSGVLVSGSSALKKISRLQAGVKILTIDIAGGNAFSWARLEQVEITRGTPSQRQNTMIVGLGEDDKAALKPEQVVLTRDKKNKMAMRPVRRLRVGAHAVVVFNTEGLEWRGNRAQDEKRISKMQLVNEKENMLESAEGLYKLTLGSTKHSLLMSTDLDAKHLMVIDSQNSNVDFKMLAEQPVIAENFEAPKARVKNTFIEMHSEEGNKHGQGMPRSYSDSDIQRLEIDLDLKDAYNFLPTYGVSSMSGHWVDQILVDAHTFEKPYIAAADKLDLGSNPSSALTNKSKTKSEVSSALTSNSGASSFFTKSEVSSMSGGSIAQVRVGTQVTKNAEGNQVSKGTDEISLNNYTSLPVNELGVRLPAASNEHTPGRRSSCRKCAFFNTFSRKKGKMCLNGALCDFCHDKHERFIHRR